jgi:hypothetical protein
MMCNVLHGKAAPPVALRFRIVRKNSESSIRRRRDDKEDRRGTECGRPEFGNTRFGR